MSAGGAIAGDLYREILRVMPVACVDIALRTRDGKYLLVKRSKEPLKGEWWVVGGRILHGETATEAACRKLRQEAGVDVGGDRLRFLGYYEDRFERNASGVDGTYHTVCLAFELVLDDVPPVILDSQSEEWCLADALPARFHVVSGAKT